MTASATILLTKLLIDGTGRAALRNGALLIEEGRIRAVGPRARIERSARGAHIVDATELVALPGLINLHAHLDMDGSPDFMTSALLMSEQTSTLMGVRSAREALHAGITTLRDLGTKFATAISVRDAITRGWTQGPRVMAAGRIVCMTGGHCWFIAHEADGPHEMRKAVRENLKLGADCIKVIATGGVLSPGVEVGSSQLDVDEMQIAVREAHKAKRRVAAHAIGTNGIHNALRAGVDTLEHGCYLDDKAVGLLRSTKATYVPTLAAPYNLYAHLSELPEYAARKTREVYEAHRESFRRAMRADVPIGAGADSGTPFNLHSKFVTELECMVALGMPAEQALAATGRIAAAALGLADEIGTLEPGRSADVVLVDEDPRKDISSLRRVRAVVACGNVYRIQK
jgi:imidazolonepropionase-like amidohydrolase